MSSAFEGKKDVDGRDKHGHDGGKQTTIREKPPWDYSTARLR
jgi:hypothetical protein